MTSAQKIINLADYGVVPNSFENATPKINEAIADADQYDSVLIKFPKGRIDLWPQGAKTKEYYISNTTESDSLSKVKTIGILLEAMKNVTLEGDETLIVSHGKMVHLAIDHCTNIKVKGLRFDYERPTMSEIEILKKTDSVTLVQVHKDSKYTIEKGKLIWYGEGWKSNNPLAIRYVPGSETMYYDSWKPFAASTATEQEFNTIRFMGDFSKAKFNKGDVLTIRDPYRDCAGILNQFSHQVSFDDIKLHYLHGLGIVSQFSEDISINNLQGEPRVASGRKIAAFADFLHFSGCYGKIKVENSLFSGSHDDCVNVHGTHLRVVGNEGNKIRVRFMHHQTWNLMAFEKGDVIGYVDNENLLVYEQATVKKVSKISDRILELELDRPTPKGLKEKHCVENMTKTPEVLIRNNRFEHTNTRGLLLTTRKKVTVENNVFYRTGMHAILIADDCNFWYESGPVKDVTIRNNKFLECGYNSSPNTYAIAIMPETHNFEKGRFVHSNVIIENNEFVLFAPPILFARSTENIKFTNNIIKGGKSKNFTFSNKPMFSLEHCADVKITSNQWEDQFSKKEILMADMNKKELEYSPKNAFELTTKQQN